MRKMGVMRRQDAYVDNRTTQVRLLQTRTGPCQKRAAVCSFNATDVKSGSMAGVSVL